MSEESEVESDFNPDYDSDDALQDAFAAGRLQPGVTSIQQPKFQRVIKNNTNELKRRLEELRLRLPWVERLDLTNSMAPMANDLAQKLEESQQKREAFIRNHNARKKEKNKINPENDPVMNEFHREMNFHRQAQAAVLLGVPKLKEAGILTKRPVDYFAQMAKSDAHMQKIRVVLMKKQAAALRSDKAKQQRQIKKMAKQTQAAAKVRKVEEKREMLAEVKKFRAGKRKDLSFLDEPKKPVLKKKPNSANNNNRRTESFKRAARDQKYGYGGKKSGSKRNTKASFEGEKLKRNFGKGGKGGKGGKAGKSKQGRPGKSKRARGNK